MPKTLAQILQTREGRAAPELIQSLGDGKLQCFACAHRCKIPAGRDGICKVRRNVGGELHVPRGYVAGLQVDPIEKKPFFHVLPGNDALSFGMLGCDLHCAYCFRGDVRIATPTGMTRLEDLFENGLADSPADEKRRPRAGLTVVADDGSERAVHWLFRRRFEGELVKIRTRFLPGFEATPEHPVLVTSSPGEEAPRFVPAGEITSGMYLALPRRHAFGGSEPVERVEALATSASRAPRPRVGNGDALAQSGVSVELDPRDAALAFLNDLVAEAGRRHADGRVSLTTMSEDLAWDAAWLVLRLGWLPSFHLRERRFVIVWRENETRRRLWRADDEYWFVPVRGVSRRPYAGWVYNLEVEGRNTYLANGLAVHNCQNWVTSQALRDPVAGSPPRDVTPAQIVQQALRENAPVLVSTYNEPLITAEWAVEVFSEGEKHGLMGAFVSNGNATEQVLDFIRPHVQAYKIDLKSFDDRRYRQLGAPLEHILDGIRMVHAKGFHLEVVSLLIPGFNDSETEVRAMARFLREISPDIAWHVTGFHDDYKMDSQGNTPASTLVRACEIGVEEGLRFVYAGNRPGEVGEWENTRCPGCKTTLVRRFSFRVLECRIGPEGACPDCGTRIPGIWDHPLRRARPASAPALPRRVM